jgi:amino acid adenylation domain-containing protein
VQNQSEVPQPLDEFHFVVPRMNDRLRPASNAQQRLWFLSRFQGTAATYEVPIAFRLRGTLSMTRLDAALTAIIERHEPLRTAIFERDGVLVQQCKAPLPIRTPIYQVSDIEEAIERARAEAAVRFDLSLPPMLRSYCFQIGPQDRLVAFMFHHVACDAWSLGVFFEELSSFFREDGIDPQPSLPTLTTHYSDYVEWQRGWLSGPQAESQKEYWLEQLGGTLPELQIGQPLAPFKVQTYAGDIEYFHWTGDLVSRIEGFAEREKTTVFTVLLAGFLALLQRYTLQDDLIVGVPVACRSLPEAEGLIGLFTNTVAIRANFEEVPRFSMFVSKIKDQVVNALGNQELPFDQVVEALSLPREVAWNPVFQAMFVMQNTNANASLRLPGIVVDSIPLHTGTAKFKLTCSIKWQPGVLEGDVEYSTEALGRAWTTRFVHCFNNLLSDAVNRPETRISELSLLCANERELLLAAMRKSAESYSPHDTMIDLFEAQTARTPAEVAIEAGARKVTYAELLARTNNLARRLRRDGAGPEVLIGICMDRSIDLIVALLAIHKCGAAFVPLDPNFPMERIRQISEDAALLFVLTEEFRRQQFAAAEISTSTVDVVEDLDPTDLFRCQVAPTTLAYVYYTSGSTGVPKGVSIEHRCAMTRLQWLLRRYPLRSGEGVLHKTPLIFDVAIWEIFLPLLSGGTVVLAEAGREADAIHLNHLLRTRNIVLAHFVPSMLETYLQHTPPSNYPALKWVGLSGEAVPAGLPDRFALHCRAELHNQYGQTETSEVAVWEGGLRASNGGVPIGRQVGAYRLYVLGQDLGLLPPAVPGELCVAGIDGLARGYHRRPDLTAERFVPNPYAMVPGERLYMTGDLARMTENGILDYLGRMDRQTKIRGCRVELGEVESVLAKHPAVRGCVAVAQPDESGSQHIVAYVVSEGVSTAALATYAERFLPGFMLPAVYVLVEGFPRTSSGKLDRNRLPLPGPSEFTARGGSEDAQTPIEVEIAAFLAQMLKLGRVGRSDNFFAIGGNSLKAVQVLSRVTQTFAVTVSVREFFAQPTVAGLAAAIEHAVQSQLAVLSDSEVARLLQEES